MHVAQSLYHDIAPASELGIPSIWINRLDEPDDPRPSRTLMTAARLAHTLDELVPVEQLMSSLRARCPNCRTFTAVAVGDGYECHSCGSTFSAGLVRVPRAWGVGGEGMVEGARIPLPYPEVAIIERDTLDEQNEAVAEALAARPIALGGAAARMWAPPRVLRGGTSGSRSSGSTRTAISTLRRARRRGTSGACRSGCSSTPGSSPPRMRRSSARATSTLRSSSSWRQSGIDDSLERALAGVEATYVALDLDVLDPSEVDVLIPEPDGPSAAEIEALLEDLAGRTSIAGIGVTGLLATERNAALAARMLAAAGF